MDISALLFACSVHADDALLLSIAYVHGRGSPYAVVDVSLNALDQGDPLGPERTPSSPAAASETVARILAIGGEPVLGLLPVRPEWATEFDKTLGDMFDPCSDIAVASAKLSEFDYACRSRGPLRAVARRGCTLDLYGRSLGLPALRRAVLADVTLPTAFPAASDAPSTLSEPGGAELFFATTPLPPAASPPKE